MFSRQNEIDSLKRLLLVSKDTVYIKILTDICWRYRNINSDSAEKYGKEALRLAEKANKPYLITLANQYLGVIAQSKGKYAESLEYYYKVIELAEKYNYTERLGYLYQSMGRMNQQQGNYEQAIKYTQQSIVIFKKLNHQLGLSYCYLTLGEVYTKIRDYPKAMNFYQQSLSLRQKMNSKEGVGAVYSLIGETLLQQGKYEEALESLRKAETIFLSLQDIRGQITVFNRMARVYTFQKKWENALAYSKKSEQLAQQTGITEIIKDVYTNIIDIYVGKNDYVNAYHYQRMLSEYKDSLLDREKEEKNQEIQAKYQTDKRLQDIELLKAENQNQRIIIYLSFVIAFLLLITGIVFYFNIQQRKRHNEQLLFQKKQIQDTNDKLAQLNKDILAQNVSITQQKEEQEKINHFKDKLFSIISHDLRNPLASLKGALELLNADFLSAQEKNNLIDRLSNDLQATSYLLDNLLNWTRTQMQGLKIDKTEVNLSSIIEENFNLFRPQAENKKISLQSNIPADIYVTADVEMTKLIVRNLIHNAIKYTSFMGTVRVNAFLIDDYVITAVQDTGRGMTKQEQDKLFGIEHFSKQGTSNEKGSGLGLLLVKDFVEKNNGTIWVESIENEGSTFSFTLPRVYKGGHSS
ncbi:tetratricopeptide repeat-containing sensor histidine kinase [Thermoflexibacter ruber]|uniref:tetratricopeptide repeat-containing sensor histidine kinase n=1 Tax=Thermoflexibacter ruber TaxID=1003 RepID=UPI001C870E16|nr:tetratricopeptide repeat protein [Thermoflexibacter ruber]